MSPEPAVAPPQGEHGYGVTPAAPVPEARRTGTMIRTTAATPVSRPAASISPASHGSASADIPASARTDRPGLASAFITTTVQSPSRTAQVRVRFPVPRARAAQGSAAAGGAGTPVP